MYEANPRKTDVTVRWRLAGWIPPSEQKENQVKWKAQRESLEVRWVDYAVKSVSVERVV